MLEDADKSLTLQPGHLRTRLKSYQRQAEPERGSQTPSPGPEHTHPTVVGGEVQAVSCLPWPPQRLSASMSG